MRLLEERQKNTVVCKIKGDRCAASLPTHATVSPAPQNP
jgi:hypothetical protein